MTRRIPLHLPAVIALGLVCQLGQIVFLRELLMVFHGNELSIGIILSAWMIWVGVGSRVGAIIVERLSRPIYLVFVTAAAALCTLPATILLIRALRGFFDVLPGAYLSFLDLSISCFILMGPVCLLLGVQFVLLARVWRENDRVRDTSGAAKTYIGEAAGHAVGGILFTFLLVHHLNSLQSAVLAGMLMVGATLWLTRKTRRDADLATACKHLALTGLLVASGIAFPFLEDVDAWGYRLQWQLFAPEYRLIATHQSKYGAISVVQREDQYSFFQSGRLVFSTAGPEATTVALEEQQGVVFAHFSLAQHPNPRRVLLIGGGLRGTLREIARHPVERIDYIELDHVLTDVARPYLSAATLDALEDRRVRLIHTDGRLFVKTSDETYDMIIVDVPDPATAVLNRCYTKEFFREAQARLNPGGVFVIGVTSTADMRSTAAANRNATIYHTLRSVFAQVLPAGGRFLYFFAADLPEQFHVDAETLRARYLERNIETEGFSPWNYDILLQEAPLRRINWIIRHHGRSEGAHLTGPAVGPLFPDPVPEQDIEELRLPPVEQRYFINSDFKPIGYYYTLQFWNELTRADHGQAFGWILRVQPWWIAPMVGVFLVAALLLRLIGCRRGNRADTHFAVISAVFTTGLSIMALQIALLFSFQSVYGFVYEMVGLIVAIFMAGLALGAATTHRFVRHKSSLRILGAVQLLVALFAGLIAIALPWSAAMESSRVVFISFSAMTFVAGLFNGADFPLAMACCMALNKRVEKAVGIVYGVELFGACAGALLASVVVAPVLGIVGCCLLAGIANAVAFLVLLISRRSYA